MKIKTNKIVALFLAVMMCISTTPVLAASTGSVSNDTSIGEDTVQNAQTQYGEFGEGTVDTEVYLTVDNKDIIVGVPTEVIISGTPNNNGNYVGEYAVLVKGDMAGNELICVTPDRETVELHQTGKTNKTANILQEQTVFDCNEIANGTTTNGTITAEGLTAGSWHSDFNFNVSIIKINKYYSSIELAAKDINDNTINTETSVADMPTAEGAACGVYKNSATGTYRIEVYQDLNDVQSITFNEDTKIDLNNHTITFADGQYLKYMKSFSIYDGTINVADSKYGVFSAKDNNESNFNMNNVHINQSLSENIAVNSYGVYTSSKNVNISDVSIEAVGKGNNSHIQGGLILNNSLADSSINIENFIFNSLSKDVSTAFGLQTKGNSIINNAIINIENSNQAVGINILGTSNKTIVDNATLNISTTTGTSQGIYANSPEFSVSNSKIWVETVKDFLGCGLLLYNTAKTEINNCEVYGKNWGIQTSSKCKTIINGGTFTSINHTGYFSGPADIYDAEFYIDNRDRYTEKGHPFGLYLGHPNSPENYTINFTRCKINNGVQKANYGLTTKAKDGYIPPKDVNLYDCEIYRAVRMSTGDPGVMFSYNYTDASHLGYTRFNLYGNTKLMNGDGTEIDKQTSDNLIANWKTATTLLSNGQYSSSQLCNMLIHGFVANVDTTTGEILAVYLTDDANVYDYRN